MDSSVTGILETFFSKYTFLTYKKGVVMLRAEDTPKGVWYLKKGYVRQYMVNRSGTLLMLHIYKPNSFFPVMWVITDEPNRYYLEAMTPVELWRAPKETVREFLHDNPSVVYDLARRLLLGLYGMMHRMEHLVTETAYTKAILFLLYIAGSLGEQEPSGVILPVSVTHREIASWIGTTRETASLQIEILKKRGLIHYRRRRLIIPSITTLEKEIVRQ